MEELKFKIPKTSKGRRSEKAQKLFESQLVLFCKALMNLDENLKKSSGSGYKGVSARGWCYVLEGYNLIDKSEFDKAESLINYSRKNGFLPIDFTAYDKSRSFYNVEDIVNSDGEFSPTEKLRSLLRYIKYGYQYTGSVNFWETQNVYIQMMVEKVDVLNLFEPICQKYHIPICNAKGWSDINSRYELITRFKEAEESGKKIVLLYYADFDPAGILIASQVKKNLDDLSLATKWTTENLIVDHFGISYEFIIANGLTWIDNLKTGSGKTADKSKDYVADYVSKYGERKCEANAILRIPDIAKQDCENAILKYLPKDCNDFIEKEKEDRKQAMKKIMKDLNLSKFIDKIDDMLFNYKDGDKSDEEPEDLDTTDDDSDDTDDDSDDNTESCSNCSYEIKLDKDDYFQCFSCKDYYCVDCADDYIIKIGGKAYCVDCSAEVPDDSDDKEKEIDYNCIICKDYEADPDDNDDIIHVKCGGKCGGFICHWCKDDVKEYNGKFYCSECFNDIVVSLKPSSPLYTINIIKDEEIHCERCYDTINYGDEHFICGDCGEHICLDCSENHNYAKVKDGKLVCFRCKMK